MFHNLTANSPAALTALMNAAGGPPSTATLHFAITERTASVWWYA